MFIKMAMLISLMVSLCGGTPIEEHSIYIRTMQVVELNYEEDLVICVDAVGEEWAFEGCEDYTINDLVSCLMDTMGTEDTIFDDVILNVSYTGFQINE